MRHAAISGILLPTAHQLSSLSRQPSFRTEDLASLIQEYLPDKAAGAPAAFREHGWLVYCPRAEDALVSALLIRSLAKGLFQVDHRVSIGIANAEPVDRERLDLNRGEAFALSGRALNELSNGQTMDIAASVQDRKLQPLLSAIAALLDAHCQRWTVKQALAVGLACSGLRHETLAERFSPPITKQAFGRHLAAIGWRGLQTALRGYEEGLAANANAPV